MYQGKPDATVSFTDNDFLVITSGKTNPQIAFIWLGEQKTCHCFFIQVQDIWELGVFC